MKNFFLILTNCSKLGIKISRTFTPVQIHFRQPTQFLLAKDSLFGSEKCFRGVSYVRNKKPETARVGAPLKFLKYTKYNIVEILSSSRCRKTPERIRTRLENHFSSTGKTNKKVLASKKSHSAEKGALSSQNALFSRRFRRKSRLLQWLVFFSSVQRVRPLFVH